MTRILALTRYDRLGASSRLRTFQYLPFLAGRNLNVTVSPLFPNSYVASLQSGQRPLSVIFSAYVQRLLTLLRAQRHDLIWIEKEALPWLPYSLEAALLGSNVPYLLDFDDAVFHVYDQHHHPLVRRLLGNKLSRLMANASLVLAGNEYLADYAKLAGARQVEVLPTVIDLSRYETKPVAARGGAVPVIGWIGQRATAPLLVPLRGVLSELVSHHQARCLAVGIEPALLDLPMEGAAWSEATEVESIQRMDIGIMPLVDAPFERGKCGYKLIQYMACGLPVVASPVGVNSQLVRHGANGFLASTPEEWRESLMQLCNSPSLRRRMGAAGRALVESTYCLQVTAPKLAAILQSAAKQK